MKRTASAAGNPPRESPLPFDGVVCFGDSDWWYHNRGHYDMQMMRQLSRHLPVLYINSIGLSVPRIGKGGMFLRRIQRKLKSLRRGLVTVSENFTVFSPLVVPGRAGMLVSKPLMVLQVRRAIRHLGIRRPLVWVVCPPGARIVDALHPAKVVYQRTDRYEDYPGIDRNEISQLDRFMKQRADLTLFCSSYLLKKEQEHCRRALFADHGVDFDRFAAAGQKAQTCNAAPADAASVEAQLSSIAHPRVGFVGGIDAHTFDPQLFNNVVARLPDVNFFLVGACSLPAGWCTAPNVTLLGQQPYERVADYMAGADVLIMPWNKSDWIRACNPVKLKEYLAVGRPVVSTSFEELARYRGLVHIAGDAPQFAAAIRQVLSEPADADRLRARVQNETWTAKANLVLDTLACAQQSPVHNPVPADTGAPV